MDPNRQVSRMLLHMLNATQNAQDGFNELARANWQDVKDNLDELIGWLEKGGFPPKFRFDVNYPES